MPSVHSRALRTTAVTTALSAALLAGFVSVPTTTAQASPASTSAATAAALPDTAPLAVTFDAQDSTLDRGEMFVVSGTVGRVTDGTVARIGAGVPATFTLAVTDADGTTLGTQKVTAADDGTFSTTVPGSITAGLPGADLLTLAVRATDVSFGELEAADAGATAIAVRGKARGLRLKNSFVSSVGWVKPGESYPSTILLTNPTKRALGGARVVVRAPRGTSFRRASGPGSHPVSARQVTWRPGSVKAGATRTLVITSKAAGVRRMPTIVWRDLSTRATLAGAGRGKATSHGPKVIPPDAVYDTARYGDRPFPVVPIQYSDRAYQTNHSGGDLTKVINSRKVKGSTFNLFQEMSLDQLFPNGTVPSSGIATADFDYKPGFEFQKTDPATANSCTGATFGDSPVPAQGTPVYPERITDGVYNLPGSTQWYGADANGSAVIGSLAGVAAFSQIDSGCGPTGKIVADAVALSDPEINYSDFDTDKDGLVDFFMGVFAGCGGNGASQLSVAGCDYPGAPYDNIWPHSSSLEYYITNENGQTGFITDDQLKDLKGRKLFYTNNNRQDMTTRKTKFPVFVRVGPYNLNPETAIDKASVISHEYGHSLGLPDFYSTGGRETYGDWNLMATDKSHNIDAFGRQELGWVVPRVLPRGRSKVRGFSDSKQDIGKIHWRTKSGRKYVLKRGRDGIVHNSLMYTAKLPGRKLISPKAFDTGAKASKKHAWFSGSGNDFGCATDGGGHNIDFSVPALSKLPEGSTVELSMKSHFDIEWDYDYGFVLTSTDGREFASNPSTRSTPTTTTSNPNQNGCQTSYGNGITGGSASYTDPVAVNGDRALSEYKAEFIADTFDVSELAGAKTPVLRFSYATDPGLARPGWFFDDVKMVATTPTGKKTVYNTDFEGEGGPKDPFVFNGGCKSDGPGTCTQGWQFVKAGARADFDHGYYLEMRDRSGFDLDGNGQIDRDPIGFEAGLYLAYTDEAHGYGNAGTDDPPAQSPLDANPQPGEAAPNLNDASFRATKGRAVFSDFGKGHVDNYSDPSRQKKDGSGNTDWLFDFSCLSFKVLSMKGQGTGPQRSNGDLTGAVQFRTGGGCAKFNWGY